MDAFGRPLTWCQPRATPVKAIVPGATELTSMRHVVVAQVGQSEWVAVPEFHAGVR